MLVVLAHAMAMQRLSGWLADMTHLATPLFFLLSGVFFNASLRGRGWWLARLDALLKPYVVMLVLVACYYAWRGRVPIESFVAGMVYATGSTLLLMPLWFLPHLFLVHCLGGVLIRQGEARQFSRSVWLTVVVALWGAGMVLAPVISRWQLPPYFSSLLGMARWPGLPWSADVLPVTMACFLAGYCLAGEVRRFVPSAVCLCFAAFACGVATVFGEAAIDVNRRVFRNPLALSVLLPAGIYLLLSIAWLLRHCGWLTWLGRHSLLMLLLHLPLLRILHAMFAPVAAWQPYLLLLVKSVLCVLCCTGLVVMVKRVDCMRRLLLPVYGKLP